MEAIDRVKEHAPTSPLFLYLAYQAVHTAYHPEEPIQAPQRWIERFKHIRNEQRRKYAATVASVDEGVGQLYEALEKKGMLDNTIIVFTTDNGAPANGYHRAWGSNAPLRGMKFTLWEGGVR